jgi:hypothetical protein
VTLARTVAALRREQQEASNLVFLDVKISFFMPKSLTRRKLCFELSFLKVRHSAARELGKFRVEMARQAREATAACLEVQKRDFF